MYTDPQLIVGYVSLGGSVFSLMHHSGLDIFLCDTNRESRMHLNTKLMKNLVSMFSSLIKLSSQRPTTETCLSRAVCVLSGDSWKFINFEKGFPLNQVIEFFQIGESFKMKLVLFWLMV